MQHLKSFRLPCFNCSVIFVHDLIGYIFSPLQVFDCWFESGSMPYAYIHYPFENVELFENNFPGHFVAEGLDQTRGWLVSLLLIKKCFSSFTCIFYITCRILKNIFILVHYLIVEVLNLSLETSYDLNPFFFPFLFLCFLNYV